MTKSHTHTRNSGLIGAAAALMLVPSLALAQITVGDTLGTEDDAIRAQLEQQGYAVEEIEREDGEIEVDVRKDGQEFEIVINAQTGAVEEIEEDD